MSKEKRTKIEVLGDTMLDLGKLTFAGIVLAGIFESELNKTIVLFVGLIMCVMLVTAGVFLTTKKVKEAQL